MALKIIRREEQADGQFNGGAILEKRPVFYQNEKTFPYSNLFYWAHAWSEKGSTIGLHPHQGFEILSFVLKGSIEHFDTKNEKWIPLEAGSVQIIRAGNGISHAEKVNPGSGIFQIWFDPDMKKTLSLPASYNDYAPGSFPVASANGMTIKTFRDENGPVKMSTEGVVIREYRVKNGSHTIQIPEGKILSAFLIEGKLTVENNSVGREDFFTATESSFINITAEEESRLFTIESPTEPSYPTYASTM